MAASGVKVYTPKKDDYLYQDFGDNYEPEPLPHGNKIAQEAFWNTAQSEMKKRGVKQFGGIGDPIQKKASAAHVEAINETEREANRGIKPENRKAKGGKISSASSRADGCAVRGKTKGRFV